jgi:hypothetical protein
MGEKISTILDYIDNGHYALPEFQRGFVWNKEQVRALFDSLYRRHPIGSLLAWTTESTGAIYRGDGQISAGVVKLLLDGQQRMTTIYGVVRGRPPKFFDGNPDVLKGLMFHLGNQTFEYYQKLKMQDDPLWISVTDLMNNEDLVEVLSGQNGEQGMTFQKIMQRALQLKNILEIELHVQDISGQDKTLDVVVDIFNKVNSGGTKLSKGDLALAKICADWPEARTAMKKYLAQWKKHGYDFTLDWLLRSVNTVLTGEAKFQFLHNLSSDEVKNGLKTAAKHIDKTLNMISGTLGLDHDRVLFGRYGIPVIVRYLSKKNGHLTTEEWNLLMFWYLQAGMWGRFSGSTESFIDKDLEALEGEDGGIKALVQQLHQWHGSLRVEPIHFENWSVGARFYPVMYMLTRVKGARDWGTGRELDAKQVGAMNTLDVHHIFPRSRLYKAGYKRPEVNALANFCFLTKDTNIGISDKLPENYFYTVEREHPGALASQWIPSDQRLWKIENYREFLQVRRELLANEVNAFMKSLLTDEMAYLIPDEQVSTHVPTVDIDDKLAEDEDLLSQFNEWVVENGLPEGEIQFDYSNEDTGVQLAVFDLAWPNGIQAGLSQPVALILDTNGSSALSVAASNGFRTFSSLSDLKAYVVREVLGEEE